MPDIRLYHGDCLELMKQIPDNSVDMVLCDLPYGTTACKWDVIIPFEPLWEHYRRLCKVNAAIVLFASQPFTSMLVTSNLKMFRHEWIWRKNRGSNFANTVREPFKEHEEILVFSNGKWKYHKQMEKRHGAGAGRAKYRYSNSTRSDNYNGFGEVNSKEFTQLRVPSSVQDFNTEVGMHPTQKPVSLLSYLIRTYSDEGDFILDNCMGSGSTGVACLETGRSFIGIEKDEHYFNVAKERIEMKQKQGVQGELFS